MAPTRASVVTEKRKRQTFDGASPYLHEPTYADAISTALRRPLQQNCHPTGADQDFLLHAASSDHVCDSLPSFPARVPEQRIPNQTPTRFRNAGGNTRLSNKIYPTESTNQLIGQL